MKDITLINHLNSLAGPGQTTSNKPRSGNEIFANTLKDAIGKTNTAQLESDSAIEKLHTGEAKNLHEVMITMEKADISMRLLVAMRNKLLEAYKEIIRMQI